MLNVQKSECLKLCEKALGAAQRLVFIIYVCRHMPIDTIMQKASMNKAGSKNRKNKKYRRERKDLMEILEGTRPEIDFETETALIDDQLLDSFDIISIVSEINDIFDISINVNDLLPENFNSADAILALIIRLQEQ